MKKSIYLSDDNVTKLERIAVSNTISDKHNQPDIIGAIRYLIEHFEFKNEIKKDDVGVKIDKLQHMIEQINIAIPHLYYNTRMSSKYSYNALKSSQKVSDDDLHKFVKNIVDDTSKVCGQIQENNYDKLYHSTDHKNMKTIPIEEDKNQWK